MGYSTIQYKSTIQKAEKLINLMKNENENYKNIIGFVFQNEGKILQNNLYVDEKGVKKKLREYINKQGKVLIFRYTSLDCSDCIEAALKKIKLAENIDTLFVISDFPSISSMKYLKNKHELNNAVFLKSNETDVIETPSVFFIDSTLKISRFLIINQHDNVLATYLRNVK
jgi:hypothetical protein